MKRIFTLLGALIPIALFAQITTFPYTEDFEGATFPPTGWSIINNGSTNTWYQSAPGTGSANSGSNVARIDYDASIAHDDYLIVDQFAVTANTSDRISFFAKNRSSSFIEEFYVLVSTTGNSATDFTDTLAGPIGPPDSWQDYTFDLTSYIGQNVYIAFQAVSTNKWELYIDDLLIDGIPSCLMPDTLLSSNISTSSVDLDWYDPNPAIEWEIEYGTTGFTQGTGTVVHVTSSLPYNLSGLSANTTYDWYVRSICAVGDTSAWSSVSSFNTLCTSVASYPYTENFDGSLNNGVWSCWKVINNDNDANTWEQDDSYITPRSGAWTAHGMGNNDDHLITPQLSLPVAKNMQMKIWDIVESASYPNDYSVLVSTTGSSVADFTDTLASYSVTNTSWTERTVDLSAYAGMNIYISFWQSYSAASYYGFGLDDFTVEEIPACQAPTALGSVDNLNSLGTSVSLSWTENNAATEWEIEYGVTGFTQGTGTIVNTTSNPDTLMGLSTQTTYDWYVRSICSTTDTSGWSLMGSFTTPCAAYTAPFFENFDTLALVSPYTDLPNCWEPQVGPDYWDVTDDIVNTGHTYLPNIGDHTTGSSNYMWIDASSDITTNAMITPFIDVSGLSTPYVGFWFASNNTTNTINHTIALDAWDGSAWVNITTEIGNFPTWVKVADTLPSSIPSLTRFKIYAIANPSGTTSDYYYNDLGVDDFFVEEAPTCIAVDSLTASNPTNTSMDLSWVDPNSATEWQIEYGTTGFTQGTGTYVTVNSAPPYTLGGLTAYQTYDFYVRAVCAVGDSSAWSGPSTFTVGLPLAGNYTIDSTQAASSTNFQSFADFANILGLVGVSANVNVDVVPGSGPYNQQVIFTSYNGASASSSVSINANGETVEYEPASSDKRIIGFDNASFISIKNLKVVGLDPTYGYGMHFTNASHHISIDSTEIDLTQATSTSSTNVGGFISSGSVTSMTSTGNNASNISITNSKVDGGVSGMYYAVRFNGNSSSDLDSLIRFENNEVANFYTYGIYLNHIKNSYIGGNDIHRADKQSVSSFYGITTGGGSTNDTINANRIHNTHGSATSTTGSAYGIYNTSNDADATAPNVFVNNLIYDFNSTSGLIYGIYNLGSDNQAYVNNTISLDHTVATGGTTRGFYQTTSASGITFGNNNISITRGGTGTKHAIYLNTSASTVTSDFNNLYINSAGSGSQYVGRENGTDQATLANWQTTTYDANSVSANPLFLNAISGDLTPAETDLDGAGFNYGVPVDFNGVVRSNPPDIGAIEFTPPSCLPPSALDVTVNSTTSVDFDWTESGSATEWEISYDTTGYTLGTGFDTVVTSKPVAVSNLMGNSTYDFYVRAICGSADSSSWVGPITITTPCAAVVSAPYYESFEASMTQTPNCMEQGAGNSEDWEFTNTASGNHIGNNGTLSGSTTSGGYFAYVDDSSPHNSGTELYTPFIDVSSLISPRLTFFLISDNEGDSNGNTDFHVDVWDGAQWNDSLFFSDTNSLNAAWEQIIVDLSNLNITGDIRIRFVVDEVNGTGFDDDRAIDDIVVEDGPITCIAPDTLLSSNITVSSVDLSWTEFNSATEWQIEFDTTGFTLGTGTDTIVSANPSTLSGLMTNTTYDWYVRSICGAGDTSVWSSVSSFTTLLPYYPIGSINTEDANGDADSVNVECSISGTVVGYDRRGGGGYEFALVDLSSGFQEGITVFDFNDVSGYSNPTEGDSLLIFGYVDQFRGLTQFRPDSIVVLGTGTVPMPDTATTLDETTESILIQMNDWVLLDSTQASGSYNVTARSLDSSTTITIRIDSDSEISDSLAVVGNGWVVGDTICSLVGVGGQFDGFSSPFLGGYQVFPSLYADVTVCRLSTGIKNVAAKAKSINIYPNPTVGQFTVKSSGLNNDNALVTVRDISGRIVLQDNIAQSNSPFTKQYDLSGKAKGLYFISIIDGEERINQKLIVQ